MKQNIRIFTRFLLHTKLFSTMSKFPPKNTYIENRISICICRKIICLSHSNYVLLTKKYLVNSKIITNQKAIIAKYLPIQGDRSVKKKVLMKTCYNHIEIGLWLISLILTLVAKWRHLLYCGTLQLHVAEVHFNSSSFLKIRQSKWFPTE